ncbi:hypothetical protein DV735_g1428, partial [Chaetothyriales sp. CBS 134920]
MARSYTLYTYYGSTCSQRVRIALALKGIQPEYKFVHLLKNEHQTSDYGQINPNHSLPTLIVSEDGKEIAKITQSLAILEFLDETIPDITPLLPPASDPVARSKVRTLADIIACDVQPVTNLRVVNRVKAAGLDLNEWQTHFMNAGFEAFEKIAAPTAGKYSYGDTVTLADCALFPAIHRAGRFNLDFSPYPNIQRIAENLEALEGFSKSSWLKQPDTPPKPPDRDTTQPSSRVLNGFTLLHIALVMGSIFISAFTLAIQPEWMCPDENGPSVLLGILAGSLAYAFFSGLRLQVDRAIGDQHIRELVKNYLVLFWTCAAAVGYSAYLMVVYEKCLSQWQIIFFLAHLSRADTFPGLDNAALANAQAATWARGIYLSEDEAHRLAQQFLRLPRTRLDADIDRFFEEWLMTHQTGIRARNYNTNNDNAGDNININALMTDAELDAILDNPAYSFEDDMAFINATDAALIAGMQDLEDAVA